jgi:hypothetical protein
MAGPKQNPLTRSELVFWQRAFLAAEISTLLKSGTRRMNPAGAAHLAAEYANAAVAEFRNAKNGGAR